MSSTSIWTEYQPLPFWNVESISHNYSMSRNTIFSHVILLIICILVCTTEQIPMNSSVLTYFTSKEQFPETREEILISTYKLVGGNSKLKHPSMLFSQSDLHVYIKDEGIRVI